jgi:CheY-like chemotaxis protein
MRPARLVYLVDDNAEDRAVMRRLLDQDAQHSYRYREFDDVESTLRGCLEQRPDCLVVDYVLGEHDGLELLDRLCAALAPRRFRS